MKNGVAAMLVACVALAAMAAAARRDDAAREGRASLVVAPAGFDPSRLEAAAGSEEFCEISLYGLEAAGGAPTPRVRLLMTLRSGAGGRFEFASALRRSSGLLGAEERFSLRARRDDGALLGYERVIAEEGAIDARSAGLGASGLPGLAGEPAWPAPALPFLLRGLGVETSGLEIALVGDEGADPSKARLVRVGEREVLGPEGPVSCDVLELRTPGGISEWAFERAAPHALLRLRDRSGATWRLLRRELVSPRDPEGTRTEDWWPEALR